MHSRHFGVSASNAAGNSHRTARLTRLERKNSVRRERIGGLTVVVVQAHPLHRRLGILIAALRREIDEVVGADQQVESTRVGRVGAVDLRLVSYQDRTEAGQITESAIADVAAGAVTGRIVISRKPDGSLSVSFVQTP